jgi:hypothetical protein
MWMTVNVIAASAASIGQRQAIVIAQREIRIIGHLPEMAIEIGEIAAVATPESILRRLADDRPGAAGAAITASTASCDRQFHANATPRKFSAMTSKATLASLANSTEGNTAMAHAPALEEADAVRPRALCRGSRAPRRTRCFA